MVVVDSYVHICSVRNSTGKLCVESGERNLNTLFLEECLPRV